MVIEPARPALPANFQFSQSALADFDACRRLFYLRWIERLEWPARPIGSDDGLSLGQRFHRLMRQHFAGIDADRALAAEPADSPLRGWWDAFLTYPPDLPEGARFAELNLSIPWDQHRLVAKFDLLAVAAGRRAVIADWKTGRRQSDDFYQDNWQTCLYPYLLAEAGAPYWGGPLPAPDCIEMLYWFAERPTYPLRLPYSAGQHAANARRLGDAIAEIAALPAEAFETGADEATCTRCVYQAYCARGSGAGALPEERETDDDSWDWTDAPEVAY